MDKIAMLTEILAQDSKNAFARYGLAMEYAGQEKFDAAFAEFDKLLADNADYVPGYQMYAQTLVKAGRTEAAIVRLRSGMECAQRVGNSHALGEMSALLEELSAT
jgi:cytochrome c-type biogenesis protein CcmH/NrfG